MNTSASSSEIPEIKAVGLFAFNPESGQYEQRAAAVLDEQGTIQFDGQPELVNRLRNEAVAVHGQTRIPDDGPAYLLALIQRFTTPYLKALPLRAS